MEKKISKTLLDAAIYLTREYWNGCVFKEEALTARMAVVRQMQEGSDLHWLSVLNFLDGIIGSGGIGSDADSETIYSALQLFGWELV